MQRRFDLTAAVMVATMMIAAGIVGGRSIEAAGQGQQSRPAPASAGGDACSLLTRQDATTALGEPVKGPDASGGRSAGASSCEYSGSGVHVVHLNVMHLTPDMASMYKALCAQKGKEGLTGLGDVTCWYNSKHEELQVLKGNTFFSIELRKSGDPTEAIKGVARQVFDRVK